MGGRRLPAVAGSVEVVAGSSWSYRSDVWWAHVAALLALAVGLIGVVLASGPGAPAEFAAVAVVTAAGFEAKARWPRLPTLVLAVWTGAPVVALDFHVWSEVTFFLLVIVVSFVALTEPDWRIRLGVDVAGVLAPAFVAAFGDHPFRWPFWMIGITFGWLSGVQMRRFRILVDELEATRERLAVQAVHLERRRIAADLHDLVGHSLTVVLLYLTGARRQMEDDPAGAADALREAEEVGRSSLAEIRRNVAALRDPSEGNTGMPTAGGGDLADLVNRMVAAGTSVELEVDGDPTTLEAIVGVVVYRVVQESLNNAVRHAPGTAIRVEVTVRPQAVDVSVANDGPTAAANGRPGVGLIGMRERVEAVGGTLHAGPASRSSAGGWVVQAWVPRPALVDHGLRNEQP